MTRVVSKSPSMIPVKVHPDAVFLFGQAMVALRQACYYRLDRVARRLKEVRSGVIVLELQQEVAAI